MDVLDLARRRRSALAHEVAKLDDFISMGEQLAKSGKIEGSQPNRGGEPSKPSSSEKEGPMPLRQSSAGASKD